MGQRPDLRLGPTPSPSKIRGICSSARSCHDPRSDSEAPLSLVRSPARPPEPDPEHRLGRDSDGVEREDLLRRRARGVDSAAVRA